VCISAVTASPLGFHPLQEIAGYLHFQLWLPLFDEQRHDFVKQRFMPLVNNLGTFLGITAGAQGKGNTFMVERNGWFGITKDNRQQVPPTPKKMALAPNEASRCFAGLAPELFLPLSNPDQLREHISTSYFDSRLAWSDQRNVAVWRINRKVDMFDVLPRDQNRNLPNLDCLAHLACYFSLSGIMTFTQVSEPWSLNVALLSGDVRPIST